MRSHVTQIVGRLIGRTVTLADHAAQRIKNAEARLQKKLQRIVERSQEFTRGLIAKI